MPQTALFHVQSYFPFSRCILLNAEQYPSFMNADQALQAALPTGGLPSALVGSLLLTSALLLLDQASQPAARDVIAFFGPAAEFLQRWLPLFFTPAVVLLPHVLRNVSITEGIKMVLVLGEIPCQVYCCSKPYGCDAWDEPCPINIYLGDLHEHLVNQSTLEIWTISTSISVSFAGHSSSGYLILTAL
jgi:hypothetical protein